MEESGEPAAGEMEEGVRRGVGEEDSDVEETQSQLSQRS